MIPVFSISLAAVLWTLPEVNCGGCEQKVRTVFSDVAGAQIVSVDIDARQICIEGEFDHDKAIAGLQAAGYSLGAHKDLEQCTKPKARSLWDGVEGDVQIVSTGERLSLRKSRVDGKYTLFDFGGPWCPPCLVSTRVLATELSTRSDLAVRAIELGDATTAFEAPVAFQHLSDASGVPWFILFDPSGKEIYRGGDIQAVLGLLP